MNLPDRKPKTSVDSASAVVHQGIAVSCRVRPLNSHESLNPKAHIGVRCLDNSIILEAPEGKNVSVRGAAPKDRQFSLDHVFHSHSSQDEVYRTSCQHVVKGLFDGINGSVLAYGSTGAGKTYTMFGSGLSAGGVIYQAVQDIFDEKARLETNGKYVAITCTFLEVYNEEVFDLLAKKRQPLAIREDEGNQLSRGGGLVNVEALSIKGLTRAAPCDIVEFDGIIELGRRNRFTATTNANEQSSRSHAIISVEVEVRENESSTVGTIARIRLCDLAGSERAAATANKGLRIREGGNINKSLLALGTVVQALAKRSKLPPSKASEVFVPYRGSKLTRLLRDCLGGNCNTSMLFCVTPSISGFEENCNTMLFAMQAKLVQITAKRNEFTVNVAEVARNQENIIERLRAELSIVKDELTRVSIESGRGPVDFNALVLSATGVLALEEHEKEKSEIASNQNGGGCDAAATGEGLAVCSSELTIDEHIEGPAGCGVGESSAQSPSRQCSSSLVGSLMTSPTVVTLVDGGALIVDVPSSVSSPPSVSSALVHTPRCLTPTASPSQTNAAYQMSQMVGVSAGSVSQARARCAPVNGGVYLDAAAAMNLHCTELRERLKEIVDEKTALHRDIQANSDKQVSLELQIRRERMLLCTLMAAMPRGELPNPPPIRVVGQMQAISQAQSRLSDLCSAYKDLNADADRITAKVNAIGKETIRERTNNPVVELLVENASLKFALLDAEAFASEYNTKLSQAEAKYEEATDALHRCQDALRELILVADAKDKERERDYERALLLANGSNGVVSPTTGASASCGGGAAGSGAVVVLGSGVAQPSPPSSLGRRCAAALALSTTPESNTDEMMEHFRKVFTKCYSKLSSKGAMEGDAAASVGIYAGLGLAEGSIKNGTHSKVAGIAGVKSGKTSLNSTNFARTLSSLPSNLSSVSMVSAGVQNGGGVGSGTGANSAMNTASNFSRLLSCNPQSMLSSQTMRDLRKKAGLISGGNGGPTIVTTATVPTGSGSPALATPSSAKLTDACLGTPARVATSSVSAGTSSKRNNTPTSHCDPTPPDHTPLDGAPVAQMSVRNTSPYTHSNGNTVVANTAVNGGGASAGVGFTVSRANGRPSERGKAPAACGSTSGPAVGAAGSQRAATNPATSSPSGNLVGVGASQGGKAPSQIIRPRDSK